MKDVLISIKGKNRPDGGETDAVELVTGGSYNFSQGETVFQYEESALTGLEGTTTTFQIRPGVVTMTRAGNVRSQMVFQPGRKHVFLYETPYGAATMGVDTRQLQVSLGESGGDIHIAYTLDMDSIPVSRNSFDISIKEV